MSATLNYKAKVRLGLVVALGLAVLTIVEYFVAKVENPTVWLIPFMVAKGALILEYFMHLSALRRAEGVEGGAH